MAKLNRGLVSNAAEKLKKEQEEARSGWGDKYLTFKAGHDYRVRLLSIEEPSPKRFETPYIDSYVHAFKDEANDNKYSIVTCPTTFEPLAGFKKCPICTHCKPLYESKNEDDKKLYDLYKRRYNGYLPVYVIEDTCNPKNVGKIKIMRYGIEIDKFLKLKIWGMKKEFNKEAKEEEKKPGLSTRKIAPLGDNAFNFDEGYDLCITVGKKGDYNTYTCEFDMQTKYNLSQDENFNQADVDAQLEEFDFYSVVPNYKQADVQAFFEKYVLNKDVTETENETEKEPDETISPTRTTTIGIPKKPVTETPKQEVVATPKPVEKPAPQPEVIQPVSKDELEDLLSGLQ